MIAREPKFPKIKAKGELKPQRIRVTNRSSIEEVDESGNSLGSVGLENGMNNLLGAGKDSTKGQKKSASPEQEKPEFEI